MCKSSISIFIDFFCGFSQVHGEQRQQVYGCLPRLDPDPATGKPVAGPVSVRTQRSDPSQQQQFTFYPLKMSKHTRQTQSAIQAQPRRLRFSRDSLQKVCNMLRRLGYAQKK